MLAARASLRCRLVPTLGARRNSGARSDHFGGFRFVMVSSCHFWRLLWKLRCHHRLSCSSSHECIAIPLATPTLIDRVEPYCVMCRIRSQASIIASLSPGPSCPNTSTHGSGMGTRSIGSDEEAVGKGVSMVFWITFFTSLLCLILSGFIPVRTVPPPKASS